MSALPGVSIIIPNFNYGHFIAAAIDSALAQDHPLCEVIVVDDCSTDSSRDVIARYSAEVRTICLPRNMGQVAAINAGWPQARFPIVMFLDSDDLLLPHAASTVAQAWSETTAKIQFPMLSVDSAGKYLGHTGPKFPTDLSTQAVREQMLQTGTSPAAPGSGNAYAKWLLDKIAPIEGLMWMDAILEFQAPFHGDVVTLQQPLACYRIHQSNWNSYHEINADRFNRLCAFYEAKLAYITANCNDRGISFDPARASRRCLWYLQSQLALSRLTDSQHPRHVPAVTLLQRALSAIKDTPHGKRHRTILSTWFILVALLPRSAAKRLIALRFLIASRPRWLEGVIVRRQPTLALTQPYPVASKQQ